MGGYRGVGGGNGFKVFIALTEIWRPSTWIFVSLPSDLIAREPEDDRKERQREDRNKTIHNRNNNIKKNNKTT